MEILVVLVVLAVIAAAAFLYMRSRNAGPGLTDRDQGPALRGSRGAARASHHDPMAEAVERHAQATDPHEAAQAELQLQAQANRVAADLHSQQASTLESHAGGHGFAGRSTGPADAYGGAAEYDEAGRPIQQNGAPGYQNGDPAYQGGAPVYQDQEVFETKDGRTIDAHGRPVSVDADPAYGNDQPVAYESGRPAVYEDGTPVADDDRAAYYDEQGRPVYPEDRPQY